jgi:hypothetical protein
VIASSIVRSLCMVVLILALGHGVAEAQQRRAPRTEPATGSQPVSWKVLLVAGDDAQPVFNNAVDAMYQRVAASGIPPADISVLKADAPARESIANRANIDAQSRRLAGPAGTGCFVFFTSHGHPRGGLIVRRPNGVVSPRQLDQMLEKACAERPTVVVTSGCFSGVYTSDSSMRRPNRVLLAAARADLPSFGCGASERYTYYDQCFLESAKRGMPWTAIASSIGACVDRTERRRGNPPSLPQSFFGSKVATLVAF